MLKKIRKCISKARDRRLKWKCLKIAAKAGADQNSGDIVFTAFQVYKWVKENPES